MLDERQRDYVLDFSTLNAGTILPAQQVKIDSDAPFCLREVGFLGQGGVTPQSITIKYQDAEGRFLQQDYIASFAELPHGGDAPTGYTGFIPAMTPQIPQLVFPPNTVVVVYLNNTGKQNLTSPQILLRGSTLHPRGTILNASRYPTYFRELQFAYVNQLYMDVSPKLNAIQNVKSDADFACRAMQLTPVAMANISETSGGTTIKFTATAFGTLGNGVTIILINSSPTPNVAFSVAVNTASRTITVTGATNGAGTNTTVASAIVAGINGNASAAFLVSAALIGPDGSFTAGTYVTAGGGVIQSTFGQNWLILFKDQNQKLYQTGGSIPTLANSGVFPDSILGHLTPQAPGLWVPEIYIPRNNALYFDIQAPAGVAPIGVSVRFIGAKIFESRQPC